MSTRRAAVAGLLILLVAGSAACARAAAHPGARTVVVRIHYSHFEPSEIRVEPGETIRFVVENVDPIDHEFLVGDRLVQRIHELGTEAHHPRRPGEMSVPAHTTRVTTYTFPARDGSLIFGCHLPGHYAYGMRGEITIG